MTRTQSFLMGAAGALALLVLVVGVAWAGNIFTVDRDGTVRLTISDTGNVGIGTTTPTATLDIRGNNARITSDNSNWAQYYLRRDTDPGFGLIAYYGNNASGLQVSVVGDNNPIRFFTGDGLGGTGSLERMRIRQNGNVGVGTVSPATSAKLEIAGTDGAILIPRLTTVQRDALTAANGMIVYNTTTNAFNFFENGAWATK